MLLCDAADAEELVLGAKVLFDVDRAIDLYGLGTHPTALGEAELRGAAYGLIIGTAATNGFADTEVVDLLEEIAALWNRYLYR